MRAAATQGVLFDLDNTLTHRGLSIASYARRFAQDFAGRLEDADAALIGRLIGLSGFHAPTSETETAATIAALDQLEGHLG